MPDNVTLDPPITNVERLLANAAGMEGVSVDETETRIERYLKAICDRLDSVGSKLHLVVNCTRSGNTSTLDKTWQEIHDGGFGVVVTAEGDQIIYSPIIFVNKASKYTVEAVTIMSDGSSMVTVYEALSASSYPVYEEE